MIPFFLITLSHLLLRCTSHSFFLALQPTICILAQAYVCFVRVFSSISELIKLIWSKVNGTRGPKVSVHLLLHIHLVLLDEIIFAPLTFDHIRFMSHLFMKTPSPQASRPTSWQGWDLETRLHLHLRRVTSLRQATVKICWQPEGAGPKVLQYTKEAVLWRGATNKWRHYLQLVHKQAHDKS